MNAPARKSYDADPIYEEWVDRARAVQAGSVQVLGHIGQVEMQVCDVFEIHTPGGGGFGAA